MNYLIKVVSSSTSVLLPLSCTDATTSPFAGNMPFRAAIEMINGEREWEYDLPLGGSVELITADAESGVKEGTPGFAI